MQHIELPEPIITELRALSLPPERQPHALGRLDAREDEVGELDTRCIQGAKGASDFTSLVELIGLELVGENPKAYSLREYTALGLR